jgi:hypothetical protein
MKSKQVGRAHRGHHSPSPVATAGMGARRGLEQSEQGTEGSDEVTGGPGLTGPGPCQRATAQEPFPEGSGGAGPPAWVVVGVEWLVGPTIRH